MKHYLTHQEVQNAVGYLATEICTFFKNSSGSHPSSLAIYPIPRGGVPVVYMLKDVLPFSVDIVDNPEDADIFVDDLIDTGSTKEKFLNDFPSKPFFAAFDKQISWADVWLVFPWEREGAEDDSIVQTITNRLREKNVPFAANDNISDHINENELKQLEEVVEKRAQSLLESLLIDTKNDHNTQGTARRLAKMYCREVYAGRYKKAPEITFFPNAKKLDEMYVTGPITVRTACSHHFCPVIGKAWVGIVPGERIAGLSKFNRIVEWLCARPQIQEELVVQIADYIETKLKPKGLAVVVKASHSCMTLRGVKEQEGALMTTSVIRGVIKEKPEARAEFFSLIND